MTPEAKADLVATIARTLAYRQRHHIGHTGHTVRRLMEAVSDLLGKRVQVIEAPQYDAGLRTARSDPDAQGRLTAENGQPLVPHVSSCSIPLK